MPTKQLLKFIDTDVPIREPVTKFGGQPIWMAEPQWPLSAQTGEPMQFICQLVLGDFGFKSPAKMAYLFMTDSVGDEFVDGTYEPDGGENAVILQPGIAALPVSDLNEGPSLYRMVETPGMDRLQPQPCEFRVELIIADDIDFVSEETRFRMSEEDRAAVTGILEENKIGGSPVFMQGDEFPFDGECQLLLQLDSCSVPFYINFGDAGVGYAFLNADGDEAKFLWQCG